MIDEAEILVEALRDFGIPAQVKGELIKVLPHLKGDVMITDVSPQRMLRTSPYVIARASQIEALGIVEGNQGDVISIKGQNYTILSLDEEDDDMITLNLEKH